MLVDLSRHAQPKKIMNVLEKEHELAYTAHSLQQQKLLHSDIKSVCANNLTQGSVEQYFKDLKQVQLKGERADRLDDLVEKLQKEIITSQKLFSDYVYHQGFNNQKFLAVKKNLNDCAKIQTAFQSSKTSRVSSKLPYATSLLKTSSKRTSVVESKFKKSRKSRSSGYYSSKVARRKIKFAGKILNESDSGQRSESKGNIQVHDDKLTSDHLKVIDVDKRNRSFYSLNEKEQEAVENFSAVIWSNKLSVDFKLSDCALVSYDFNHLSWIDLHTLNSSPSAEIFHEILKHFGTSGVGWLSKNVVDAYALGVVEASNMKSKTQDFGCLTVDDCTCIIKQRVKNVIKFSKNILSDECTRLCTYTFFPILLHQHFMILWFNSATSCLTLVDSAPPIQSNDIIVLRNSFTLFLDNFGFTNNNIIFKQATYMIQPDTSSCGVCVCMAIESICNCIVKNLALSGKLLVNSVARSYTFYTLDR